MREAKAEICNKLRENELNIYGFSGHSFIKSVYDSFSRAGEGNVKPGSRHWLKTPHAPNCAFRVLLQETATVGWDPFVSPNFHSFIFLASAASQPSSPLFFPVSTHSAREPNAGDGVRLERARWKHGIDLIYHYSPTSFFFLRFFFRNWVSDCVFWGRINEFSATTELFIHAMERLALRD